jgi:hypothetical protein
MHYSLLIINCFNALCALKLNGARRVRTADPLHAMQVLSQLSYSPKPNKAAYFKGLDNMMSMQIWRPVSNK